MKEWIKIAGCVLLIPPLGLYPGMRLGAVLVSVPVSYDQDLSKFAQTIGGIEGQTFLAFLTLVVIAVQAWILHRQTGILKRSTGVAEDNYLATHRPQIRVKHLFLRSDIWTGKPIIAALVFANIGSTKAIIISVRGGSKIVRSDEMLPAYPPLGPSLTPEPDKRCVPPGQLVEISHNEFGAAISEPNATAIRDRSAMLYCFGGVEYKDSHERIRTTNFCYRLVNAATSNPRFQVYRDDPDYEYQD
jgi:hypothetical protein